MKPLAENLTEPSTLQNIFRDGMAEGQVTGFLLDSSRALLKQSGLITHRDAVMPLDALLGDRATLCYIDPRPFDPSKYKAAVRDFTGHLMASGLVKFELEPPCLLVMRHRQGQMTDLASLDLDPRGMCLWYGQVHAFLCDYLSREAPGPDLSAGGPAGFAWKKHAGSIGLEAVKASVGALCVKLAEML